MTDDRPLCFVVMGFGLKTDYESGRTLDLNATYEAIIEPAVTEAGLRCVRADEILHSGVIDGPMYDMLLRADLVVADISTGNVNAVYELGVRHALRPYSTIIMKEQDGRLHFDLSHIMTFQYKHLGDDIGVREAARAKGELVELIRHITQEKQADSPVYHHLPGLLQPTLSDEEFDRAVDDTEDLERRLSALLNKAKKASGESNHGVAAVAFRSAHELSSDDPYLIQQWALATYKSKNPGEEAALYEGLRIISVLQPDVSNDPETLGITGAIYKRLWLLKRQQKNLDKAISYYRRGFEIRRDYYNGENLAVCYAYRAEVQTDPSEAEYDRKTALKVREAVVAVLEDVVQSETFLERSDRKWVFATLANCNFALGKHVAGKQYEAQFKAEKPATWEFESYEAGKMAVLDD